MALNINILPQIYRQNIRAIHLHIKLECIISNVFRSEEENIIISDLSPATWYSVQLTAHNGAGSRVITSEVATLDTSGRSLTPRGGASTSSTPVHRHDTVMISDDIIMMMITGLEAGQGQGQWMGAWPSP